MAMTSFSSIICLMRPALLPGDQWQPRLATTCVPKPYRLRVSAKKDTNTELLSPQSVDVSVFRFTLGIPGFDDGDLPRVIGVTFGAVLILNHFLSPGFITPAQWRSEIVGLLGAIFCIYLPYFGKILIGETSTKASTMDTSRQIFAMSSKLTMEDKEELAWGSYVLLKNTRATSVAIFAEELVCARGYWDVPNEREQNVLEWLEENLRNTSLVLQDTTTYFPSKADKQGWKLIPRGTVSCLFVPLKGARDSRGVTPFMLLLSNVPNAFSDKDLLWTELLLQKYTS